MYRVPDNWQILSRPVDVTGCNFWACCRHAVVGWWRILHTKQTAVGINRSHRSQTVRAASGGDHDSNGAFFRNDTIALAVCHCRPQYFQHVP